MRNLQGIGLCGQRACQLFAESRSPGRLDLGRRGGQRGRVIPHASRFGEPASPAGTLSIPVIQPPFGTLAMATTGTAKAIATRGDGALRATVDLAAITVTADAEQILTARAAIDSQRSRLGGHSIRRGPESRRLRRSRIAKTCDNPGRSSLCACSRQRGSSTRGPGVTAPGPHLSSPDGRAPDRGNVR